MKLHQTAHIISTYSADNFGVCSALFELGGMVVMHDPSGCNSTYTTHDEPRWYNQDSLIFISALTEQDAVLGRDDKFISDIVSSAQQFKPAFICIIPSQIAFLIGTDMKALAKIITQKTGITCFTLPTNSMHYYPRGIYYALDFLADEASKKTLPIPKTKSTKPVVNLLGVTPLDFSVNGAVSSLIDWLTNAGFTLGACWAMTSDLATIEQSVTADINLVVTYGGLGAARRLNKAFGTPFVIGTPLGPLQKIVVDNLKASLMDKKNRLAYRGVGGEVFNDTPEMMTAGTIDNPNYANNQLAANNLLIGESIYALSLARALELSTGLHQQVIVPVETERQLLLSDTLQLTDETDLMPLFAKAQRIIGDPMYKPIVPANTQFIDLPHEGFSGRLYSKQIPNLIVPANFSDFSQRCK